MYQRQMASRQMGGMGLRTHLACERSHSRRFKHLSRTAGLFDASCRSRSAMDLGGMSTFEYMSARAVKKGNMLCVGFRKLNCGHAKEDTSMKCTQNACQLSRRRACGFVCSRLVRPVRKLFPFRATNCAVNLMTSKSSAVIPSGNTSVYCSCAAGICGNNHVRAADSKHHVRTFSGSSRTTGLK